MSTGLPYAYFTCFGEKMHIVNPRNAELWSHNPYVSPDPIGSSWNLTHNAKRDYMIYYPVRLFYDMTGLIVDRNLVQPNLYRKRNEIEMETIVVSDQAGWPSRRGYPYYDDLIRDIRNEFRIVYVRNTHFRDCFGTLNEPTITYADVLVEDPTTAELIDILNKAGFYIGYESGYCSLAGALNVPYVNLTSAVPPINVCHNSCIYHLDICSGYCCAERCDKMCLQNSPDKNEEILAAIYRTYMDLYDGGWND